MIVTKLIQTFFDLLKHNQEEMNDIKDELKTKDKKELDSQIQTHDPLAFCGIRLEKVDTGKEVATWDLKCYNCWKQGHYSRNYPTGKVRNKAYFKEKMSLAVKEEQGQVLIADEYDFSVETDDEGEQLDPNVVFMTRLEMMNAFEAEHADVAET
ncbi:hypothetical protein Tco_1233731 [Tanacetum coccineum]